MDKNEAREKIQELIEKYNSVKQSGQIKNYSEEDTKKDFIIPLFNALGWNTTDRNEVSSEEYIKSAGRVDYGFYIDGRVKFYVEAKALSADLNREEFANQSIRYSWNRGITWAILVDFESIKVFNAEAVSKYLGDKLVFEIPYAEYISRFDQLWQLSRESFETNSLDKYAEDIGKKLQRVPVSELLYEDLNECRNILLNSLRQWNSDKNISNELLEEGVQKLIDRLIFIRVLEDRSVEESTLKPLVREWEASSTRNQIPLYKYMVTKFRELDSIYNSSLFSEHPFEEWDEYSDATKKVIGILYGKKGYYEYDFKVMPADILGNVYENYLGYILSQSKKGIEITEDSKKRKEQGIYYTPSFIVDYIVENSLKPILDKCKTIADLKKIKVLDPACGSGSFLIKALEVINDKYVEFGAPGDEFTKLSIVTENLYGVDLDQQAVEIARLNLLINALDRKMMLPSLTHNIRNGNSLVSGTSEELEKWFGKDYQDKKPFDWQEEFPEVFSEGGFDVIVGNPPYIKEFVNKDAFNGLHDNPYYQGKMDLWTMFACISIDLLKNNGVMGFIAPNNWVTNAGASIMRNKILTDGELKTFIDFGDYKVFQDAGIQTMIYLFEKQKPRKKYEVDYLRINDKNVSEEKLILDIFSNKAKIEIEPGKLIDKNITFSNQESGTVFDKIESKKNFELTEKEVGQGIVSPQEYVIEKHLPLLQNARNGDGIFVLNSDEVENLKLSDKEIKIIKPFYTTNQISRYYANSKNESFIIYANNEVNKNIDKYPKIKEHLQKFAPVITSDFAPFGLHRARDEKFFIGPSIFSIRKTERPQFSYVNFSCYVSQTYFVISTDRVNLKFLTGILNSNLIYFWLKTKGKLQGDFLQVDKGPLMEIPICIGDKEQQKQIITLVDRMISLNKEIHNELENSNKWENIKFEIKKTDKKIDEEVYKLYDLTPEEIKIVEDLLKQD